MQQDRELLDALRADLAELTALHAPSGAEQPVIARLRSLDPKVTAIICSGYSDEAALSEFLTYGFRGALPKPFTRRELADVLQRAFEADKVN